MPPIPNFNRLLKSIYYEEPDRLPLVELWIDSPIKAAVLNSNTKDVLDFRSPNYNVKRDIEFWYKAGYDYALLAPRYAFPKSWLNNPGAYLTNFYEYEKYPWPTIADVDFTAVEEAALYLPEKMKIIVTPQAGIFEEAWMTMGYKTFMLGLFEQPDLIQKICNTIGKFLFQVFEKLATYEHVGGFWLADDIACSEALIMSPGMIRSYFMHWYEKYAYVARKHNKIFAFHSDGHLTPLLDDLIAINVNAIHPIEPKAMDLKEVKKKVHGKLALWGSVDQDFPLTRGSTHEVKRYIIKRIREIAPGGGFAIGSSSSIIHNIRLENYLAMINTVMEYGVYPINGTF